MDEKKRFTSAIATLLDVRQTVRVSATSLSMQIVEGFNEMPNGFEMNWADNANKILPNWRVAEPTFNIYGRWGVCKLLGTRSFGEKS